MGTHNLSAKAIATICSVDPKTVREWLGDTGPGNPKAMRKLINLSVGGERPEKVLKQGAPYADKSITGPLPPGERGWIEMGRILDLCQWKQALTKPRKIFEETQGEPNDRWSQLVRRLDWELDDIRESKKGKLDQKEGA